MCQVSVFLRVFLGGPADLAGLRVGDKVISVNGVSVVNVDHYDAVEVLKACGRVLVLVIIREVTRIVPPYEHVCTTAVSFYLERNIKLHFFNLIKINKKKIFGGYCVQVLRKDSVCSSLSTSRAPSATSYVSSTALSHTLENGDTTHETTKVTSPLYIF